LAVGRLTQRVSERRRAAARSIRARRPLNWREGCAREKPAGEFGPGKPGRVGLAPFRYRDVQMPHDHIRRDLVLRDFLPGELYQRIDLLHWIWVAAVVGILQFDTERDFVDRGLVMPTGAAGMPSR